GEETASCARVGELVAPHTDPISGQPEAEATPAAIAPVLFSLRGFTRTRHSMMLPQGTWWARVAVADGSEYRLATSHGPMVWHDFAYRMLACDARLAEELETSGYRAAAFVDGELDACVCLGPADAPLQWIAPAAANACDNAGVLAARRLHDYIDATEPVVCACYQVALDSVRKAVASGVATTVGDIGATLRAGTNCGSCLPELKRIIRNERSSRPD